MLFGGRENVDAGARGRSVPGAGGPSPCAQHRVGPQGTPCKEHRSPRPSDRGLRCAEEPGRAGVCRRVGRLLFKGSSPLPQPPEPGAALH